MRSELNPKPVHEISRGRQYEKFTPNLRRLFFSDGRRTGVRTGSKSERAWNLLPRWCMTNLEPQCGLFELVTGFLGVMGREPAPPI